MYLIGNMADDISISLQIISQTINDKSKNPYLIKSWDADDLYSKLASLSDDVAETWIKCITHLQTYAWRMHSKDCIKRGCPGDCGYDEARLFFHPKQAEYIAWNGDESWVITGNRWGKTDALVFRAVCQANGYNPLTNELYPTPQNIWIVGLDFPMVRDILVPKFKRQMPELGMKWNEDIDLWNFNKTDLIAKLFNKSEVGFKSADSGIEKFRGAGKDLICFDEEPPKEVYSEASIRVEAGRNLLIRGSMTPDPFKGLTWTYKDILKNTQRQADPTNLRIWTGATTDNPGLSENIIRRLKSKMETWEQEVRIFGNYAMGLGRCAFNQDGLLRLKDNAKEPLEIRKISDSANLYIYEERLNDVGYCIGIDTAEGLEHGDNSVAVILKRDIPPTVSAILIGKIDPDTFGTHAIILAEEYNDAWLVIETNNHGFAVISIVRAAGYGNMYSEKTFDKWGLKESRKWGWNTNLLTRPILVDAIAQAVRDNALEIYDIDTIDEMSTFIINEKGRAEAQAGCKDDRVMALGLALQGHIRCPQYEKPVTVAHDPGPINELAYMGV